MGLSLTGAVAGVDKQWDLILPLPMMIVGEKVWRKKYKTSVEDKAKKSKHIQLSSHWVNLIPNNCPNFS